MPEIEKSNAVFITRRSFLISTAAALAWPAFGSGAAVRQPSSQSYEFTGGHWFDGQKFTNKKFYSVNGTLTARKPARADSVVDLTGKFVIPPFGEAHNHNVDYSPRTDALIRQYLQDGIFYVKNPNSLPRVTAPLRGKINIPTSIDVVFANGGLIPSGGHPLGLVKRNQERGGMTKEDGEGGFYFIIDDEAELNRKWETILAGKPDFIKTYLLYSEEYAKRKDDEAYFDWKGLNPALLPEIVRRAHRAGLRVSTHVETATDFHNALVAGVDEVNHMPGFRPERNDVANYNNNLSRYEITAADAQLASRNHVFVVTTMGETIRWTLDEKEKAAPARVAVRQMLVHNLQVLMKHGVRVAIGSDSYRQNSLSEAMSLYNLQAFDNLTLLKMWCETTAATIFPRRKLGHLKEGYEASFLVLSGDPLQDFTNVQKIEKRFKQGEFLSLPA
jgi:imidazolonepropionase-like amidohydrolase